MVQDPLILSTATEVVVNAGAIQLAAFGGNHTVGLKGTIDLVTEVDLEVERMFRALVSARFPSHRILAEELQDEHGSGDPSQPRWIFDPIDGTTNYAHGLPIFCSSLAFEQDGRLEVAAVYDPARRELFTAERGAGAWLNGRPLEVSMAERLIDAMLCTGFPYDVHETLVPIVDLFGRFVGRARAVRRLGSAALDLCYVAAGRLDGFWEQRLQPWDIAAGMLLVSEAGGTVSGFDGRAATLGAGEIIASNGRIHGEMLQVIGSSPTAAPGQA